MDLSHRAARCIGGLDAGSVELPYGKSTVLRLQACVKLCPLRKLFEVIPHVSARPTDVDF